MSSCTSPSSSLNKEASRRRALNRCAFAVDSEQLEEEVGNLLDRSIFEVEERNRRALLWGERLQRTDQIQVEC